MFIYTAIGVGGGDRGGGGGCSRPPPPQPNIPVKIRAVSWEFLTNMWTFLVRFFGQVVTAPQIKLGSYAYVYRVNRYSFVLFLFTNRSYIVLILSYCIYNPNYNFI